MEHEIITQNSVESSSSLSLEEAFNPRRNSFGFLRLLFAGLVLVDHAFPLGGFGADPMWAWTHQQESLGGMSVVGFFIISGFLVTRSFTTSHSTGSYLWKRVLRIFPGYWTCLIVTVLVFAPIAYAVQNGNLHGYIGLSFYSPADYLTKNWFLNIGQYNIGNLLQGTPWSRIDHLAAFDGSLWTLIYEFKCYIAIGLLGAVGIFKRWKFLCVLLCFLLWFVQVDQGLHPVEFAHFAVIWDPYETRLPFCFSLGAIAFLYRDRIPITKSGLVIAIGVYIMGMRLNLYYAVGEFAFAYICVWCACRLPFSAVGRRTDLSYGTYIYGFPIQELVALYGGNRWGYVPYLLISAPIVAVFATGSWYLVERPAIGLKRFDPTGLIYSQVRKRLATQGSDS